MTLFTRTRRTLAVYAALLAAAMCSQAATASTTPSRLEPAIQAYLDPLLRTNNFSGVVLIAKGDEIVFEQGYGYADIEQRVPNTPRTAFHIASVSKPFTAAAIMLLAERGKIDLRAPLTKILPDYPNAGKLTIHHLLTHTSGIPNINSFPEYGDIQIKPQTPAELIEYFKAKPLEFEPGAEYSYSNSNYNLLAHIIETVSSQPYGMFLKREIFDRLKLARTGHPESASAIVPGIADGYAPEGHLALQRAAYLDWSVKTGNGSLYSEAADIVRFFRGLHQGRLLSEPSLAASFTQHTPNVGYGWFLTKANGRDIHHINGRAPGWAAQADYYVKDEVSVVVLSNLYVSVTTPIARAVGAIYFGEAYEELPDLSSAKLPAESMAALVGTYKFGPDYYVPNGVVRITSNGGIEGKYVGLDYAPFSFIPMGANKFLIRSFWVPAEFLLGADGKARELTIDGLRGVRQ